MKKLIGGIKFLCTICIVVSLVFFGNQLSHAKEAKRISMDFQEAALKDVLKVFSQQAGLNFVAAQEIENSEITLYLDGVSVQDALNSILEANDLIYEQKPNSSIFIVKKSTRQGVEMATKIYTLNYAKVAGETGYAARTDATADSSGGSGSSSSGFSSGGTSDSEEDLTIKEIIENLLAKGPEGAPYGNVVADTRTNSLIITTVPEDFPLVEKTLAQLDTRTQQVMIQAEIVEVETTAIKKLGFDWGGTTTGTFFTFSGPSRDTAFPFIRETGPLSRSLLGGSTADTRGRSVAASSTGTNFGNFSLAEFQIVLKALEKENKAKYLAKPKIMVINNETAEIKITAETTVGTVTTEAAQSGTITTEAERIETGVILKVTPTINKDNYVTMTLEPEVSRIAAANISGYYDPSKRTAKTVVMMKDGQTVAIGGLLKDDITDNDRAVPGLSKIPLLGNLFKSKDYQGISTEIIIFVTCDIMQPELELVQSASADTVKVAQAEVDEVNATEENASDTDRDMEILKTVKRLRKRRELNPDSAKGFR